MMLLRTFALWLLLAVLGQQVSVSSGARPADRAQRSGNKSAATGRGKFSIKNRMMECKWAAKDVGDTVRLQVDCENPEARIIGGETDMACEYAGKPQKCPGYQSDTKGFWKQVGRAFKRLQDKACTDISALVRAGMCKQAPRDAHFKLDIGTSRVSAQSENWPNPPPPPPAPTRLTSDSSSSSNCTKREEHRKTAEDYCHSSWVSVCSFFLSMVQSEDC